MMGLTLIHVRKWVPGTIEQKCLQDDPTAFICNDNYKCTSLNDSMFWHSCKLCNIHKISHWRFRHLWQGDMRHDPEHMTKGTEVRTSIPLTVTLGQWPGTRPYICSVKPAGGPASWPRHLPSCDHWSVTHTTTKIDSPGSLTALTVRPGYTSHGAVYREQSTRLHQTLDRIVQLQSKSIFFTTNALRLRLTTGLW